MLYDASAEALARAKANVASALDDLKRSGGSADATVAFADDLASLSASDLFIEAVFEEIDVKTEIVRRLGTMAKDGAVIASNTSYLDLDTIAAASGRPAAVLGLHFFAPAHRMKLLEVVRGTATGLETLLTGLEIARRLGKVAVVAGVGEGFIGNRIFSRYRAQAEFLLEEGALPEEVDAAAEELGFAMGPFAVSDLSGLDISWRIRRSKAATRDPRLRYVPIADRLCEAGRLGRKTGMGWYDYPDGGKGRGVPSPVVTTMIEGTRPEKYRGQRPDRAAIRRRLLGAIVNEAANALEDGVARQPGDIDVVLVQGYGYARLKGGPVFQALRMAPAEVAAMVDAVATATGFGFRRGDLRRLGIVV
jgi:3-hydroxyacyl-CoA dehydrogenase